jgi:hypothetical protein
MSCHHARFAGVDNRVRALTTRPWSLAPQAQTLDPGGLCRPSVPDGEGQARGQARKARGEPPQQTVHLSREAVLVAVTTAADRMTIKVGTIIRTYGPSPSLLTALAPSY